MLRSILFLSLFVFGSSTARPPDRIDEPLRIPVDPATILTSSTTTAGLGLQRESAGPDTFDLYGGPRRLVRDPNGVPNDGDEYVEGKFEDALGLAPRGLSASPGDWTGVDNTDDPFRWRVDTFNAANLGGHGAGNRAFWCGSPAGDPSADAMQFAPGYGSSWDASLVFESEPVLDPSSGQTIALDFVFNLDTEPDYDFFEVSFDSAGTWAEVASFSGSNRDPVSGEFEAPGWSFASRPGVRPIVFRGNDYGDGDRIRIRFRFLSDGAVDDEDELDTDGAVQIDDVVIVTRDGTFTEDFEGPAPHLLHELRKPFAGDFSNVFFRGRDIDPCATNLTPQLNFIDFGQEPPNGPGTSGRASTGGSTPPEFPWGPTYGIPGGYVVNYTNGLDGVVPLDNEVHSPPIAWDVPGAGDDCEECTGGTLSFTVYRHNPLTNGIFYFWGVRDRVDGVWAPWQNDGWVFFSAAGAYLPTTIPVGRFIRPDREAVQIRLGVVDLSANFGFGGWSATPAPWFDDVRLTKYRIGGAELQTRTIDTANDSFPTSGSVDVSDAAARGNLDVRFDMARDINSGDINAPGDSVIVDAVAVIPNTNIVDISMEWALLQNPLFDDPGNRVTPNRPQDTPGASSSVSINGETWNIITGSVAADTSKTAASGTPVADRFFADLPDVDFMYPGDILHYHFRAEDNLGNVTTLPGNTDGFGAWDGNKQSSYNRLWTVRALPSIVNDGQGGVTQPSILVYNDFGRRGGEAEFTSAFGQLGLFEGIDWDSYTTQGPSSGVSNGLGSAADVTPITDDGGDARGHGASATQIEGYSTIVYLSGNLNTQLISDGSNEGQNDKSADIELLTNWKAQADQRNTVYFGDFIASALNADSPVDGSNYVSTVMGITEVAVDVRPLIGNQTAPVVAPSGDVAGFSTSFIAYGGCFGINQFDGITPQGATLTSHDFLDTSGNPIAGVSAGTVFDRLEGGNRKVDIVFPFGDLYIYDNLSRAAANVSSRTLLLEEILNYLGEDIGDQSDAVAAPSLRAASLDLYPNPFNPKTTVAFALPKAGMQATVKVFNVRGELVKTLHNGVATSADLNLEWNGTDDRGSSVASGVYYVNAITEGFEATRKAVLLR